MLPMLLIPDVGHLSRLTRQLTAQENILRFPALRGIMMRGVKAPAETQCAYCQSAKVTGQVLYISGSKTHWLKMKALAPARHGGFAETPRFKFFLLLIKFCRTDLGVFPHVP
jgi:hypothetical protein